MKLDRDMQVFLILLLSVILLNLLPISAPLRMGLLIVLIILQALFIYRGLTRRR